VKGQRKSLFTYLFIPTEKEIAMAINKIKRELIDTPEGTFGRKEIIRKMKDLKMDPYFWNYSGSKDPWNNADEAMAAAAEALADMKNFFIPNNLMSQEYFDLQFAKYKQLEAYYIDNRYLIIDKSA
jgi:hypothetical protein